MQGQFVREMPEKVDRIKTWEWLSRSDLKVGTQALLCAAQEQAIRTNYVKQYIDRFRTVNLRCLHIYLKCIT